MAEAVPHGARLNGTEDLFRAILYPRHWDGVNGRPSSAAFDEPVFSVDVVSRTTPQQTAARFRIVLRLVQFNCGRARGLGFDARDEPDPEHPDNLAHAHVYFEKYFDLSNRQRKKKARRLSEICEAVDIG